MKTGGKIAIISLSLIAVGVAVYFTMFKKTASDYRKMIMDLVKSEEGKGFTAESVVKFKDLTDNKMSEQELKDTYIAIYGYLNPSSNQKYKNDVAFKARFNDLSKKYNIFT
jgi:TPP-dependent trihydroxycyclohexane-1,2-dione (THcHDO) dehydratase